MREFRPDSEDTCNLLDRIAEGDDLARDELFKRHRQALKRFVDFHLDDRLRARFDPSDVVQVTQLELVRRIKDFVDHRPMPFHLWQRKKAFERLLNLRRDHLRRARRSIQRECPQPDRSSILLAGHLRTSKETPIDILEAQERAEQVHRAVARLTVGDREILLLRHAEDLPVDEIAYLLGIESAAARKRFGRALIRLQKLLADEGFTGRGDT